MVQSPCRHFPCKFRRSLHVLRERPAVGIRATLHETSNVIANGKRGYVLADLDNIAGPVTTADGSYICDEPDDYKNGQ